jgi:hypothetical protein
VAVTRSPRACAASITQRSTLRGPLIVKAALETQQRNAG